jgi:hypothetical protein
MKSKTVSSILRHVATKSSAITDDSEPVPPEPATVEPATPIPGTEDAPSAAALGNEPPAAEAVEGETKKARRQRKQAEHEATAAAIDGVAAAEATAGEEMRLEALYAAVAWPLQKKYGHPYEAFKLALTYVPSNQHLVCAECRIANRTRYGARSRSRRCRPYCHCCKQRSRGGSPRSRSKSALMSSSPATHLRASLPSRRHSVQASVLARSRSRSKRASLRRRCTSSVRTPRTSSRLSIGSSARSSSCRRRSKSRAAPWSSR